MTVNMFNQALLNKRLADRDASFLKMEQLEQTMNLHKEPEQIDSTGHHFGVNVDQVRDIPSIDISQFLPENWNGTRATEAELMTLIMNLSQEGFKTPEDLQKLQYYRGQLKLLMSGQN